MRVLTPKNPAAPPGPASAPVYFRGWRPQRGASSTALLPSWAASWLADPAPPRPARRPAQPLALPRSPLRPPPPAPPAHNQHGASSHRPGGARTWRRFSVARSRGRCVGAAGGHDWQGAGGRWGGAGGAQRARGQAGSQGRSTAHRRSRTGPGRGHLNSRAPRQERVAKEEAEPAACRPNSGLDMNLTTGVYTGLSDYFCAGSRRDTTYTLPLAHHHIDFSEDEFLRKRVRREWDISP